MSMDDQPLSVQSQTGKMKSTQSVYPQDLAQLQYHFISQMTTLLENQTRTRTFAHSISELITRVHGELLTDLKAGFALTKEDNAITPFLENAITRCQSLDEAFDCLVQERQKQWQKSTASLLEIIDEFSQTINHLSTVLIEKDLFERQSQVLENIILSHEKVTQWKDFVQGILQGFHAIFPFNFFFIAFAEEHSLSLYFYYLGEYTDEIKQKVKLKMIKQLLSQLNLPEDTPLDIEEFCIPKPTQTITIDDIKLISVAVPDHASDLSGILGIAYASTISLSYQERSVIRSLLAVMVMIVGSSKVLSRTMTELEYYAIHDPLTGIHNRRYFNDMLEYEIGRSERHNHVFSILQLDLDDFKEINDTYGHLTGDEVLKKIAETICSHLRKGDIPVRLGGDEFAVILPETKAIDAKQVARHIKTNLQEMSLKSLDGKAFHVTTSIGIVSYPEDAQTFTELMSAVDVALYKAKGMGKNEVCEFDGKAHQIQDISVARIFVETLREALTEDRIQPFFQPIIDCKSGEVFAYESVARLIEPDGSNISAGQFIEVIEKYSLSRKLDRIIVDQVIKANKRYMLANGMPQRLFINLSPQEIQNRSVLEFAEKLCHQLQVPPSSIVFEILERDAIGDMTHMGKFLMNLRKKGFTFALDDFGSGYNSFHYLRELHFEYVKIDGAFVRHIVDSKIDRSLVTHLSHLCKDLGTLTIGEFVESEEIMVVLRDIGIDYAQGFHLGMPQSKLG